MYELYELQQAAWAPVGSWLEAAAELFAVCGPASFALPASHAAAGCDILARLCKRYPKPDFAITHIIADGHPETVTEVTVLDKPFCRLIHFPCATRRACPVVLIVAPLSGHHATLLRDMVCTMLPDFDIYITDWKDARLVPVWEGTFHLHDYVDYVRNFLAFLGPEIHVVSVCQSTVPVLAAVSLMAHAGMPTPRTMTLMGGPVDARRCPTAVNKIAVDRSLAWFERELIDTVPAQYPGAGRRVRPGFLQLLAFAAMHPDRHLAAHLNYYVDVAMGRIDAANAYRRFYDEYNAVLDMAAEYYLETIHVVFQEFSLARGNWHVCGETVHSSAIKDTALITVEGERDDICGQGQTHAAHDLCTGIDALRKHRLTAPACGHYGIFSGSVWRNTIYPHISKLIRQHASMPRARFDVLAWQAADRFRARRVGTHDRLALSASRRRASSCIKYSANSGSW